MSFMDLLGVPIHSQHVVVSKKGPNYGPFFSSLANLNGFGERQPIGRIADADLVAVA
ncbi:hypothetical protein GCM10023333_41660 [Ferrimonas pelagia]|uniref:Uncharacterized protein n=1 Tax=Ferrimonas pelagia TaxID=1177826 RepID=A0ABP9FIF7_9GAMM